MDVNGRNERRVGRAGSAEPFGQTIGFGEPLVSPDGRKVVVARDGVTVVTLATGASTRIGRGEESSTGWSPDSKRLAFSGRENNGLYVVDLRSGRKRTLLGSSTTWTPAWSPDAEWIAFGRQIGYGPVALWAVHPDGSGLRRLTSYATGDPGGLVWSRDGRLAFIGNRGSDGPARLVLVDVRAGRVIVVKSRFDGGSVAWSPDGRTIAYAASVDSRASAIYTVAADGSGRRRLTPSRPLYSDGSPVWSPDGRSLLFVRLPVGGGAESGVSQIWTMRADGSHQRRLTTAYPDGGDNVEPAWIRGAVHTEPAPRPREVRRRGAVVLHVPFPVDGIAAEGGRAAIAPVGFEMERDIQPTPPVLVWRPGHGQPERVVASSCGGVRQLVLAGRRLAFDCDQSYFDLLYQSLWVADLRTRVPREVFFARSGPQGRGLYLDHVVGAGRLLAFGSTQVRGRGAKLQRALWRVDGFDSVSLSARPETGDVVAAGGGRLAVELPDLRVAITTADGKLVRVLRPPRHPSALLGNDPKPPFLLTGRDLLLLEHGTLRAYDTATGELRWERRVPAGAQLEAADGRLVVYTAGSSIHLLSRGRDRVVRTGAQRLRRLRNVVDRPVHAALTPHGLYYCFNVADARYPGRVVFIPRSSTPPRPPARS
jgi:dipeptidyl aminopeptidase/acylaminoacyl peptidase